MCSVFILYSFYSLLILAGLVKALAPQRRSASVKGWARRPAAGPLRFARGHRDCRLAIPHQVGIDLPQHWPIFLPIFLENECLLNKIPKTHWKKHHFPTLRFWQEEALPDFLAPHAVAPRPHELSGLPRVRVQAAKRVVPATDQLLHFPTIGASLLEKNKKSTRVEEWAVCSKAIHLLPY